MGSVGAIDVSQQPTKPPVLLLVAVDHVVCAIALANVAWWVSRVDDFSVCEQILHWRVLLKQLDEPHGTYVRFGLMLSLELPDVQMPKRPCGLATRVDPNFMALVLNSRIDGRTVFHKLDQELWHNTSLRPKRDILIERARLIMVPRPIGFDIHNRRELVVPFSLFKCLGMSEDTWLGRRPAAEPVYGGGVADELQHQTQGAAAGSAAEHTAGE